MCLSLVVALLLALVPTASAHTLPISLAKSKASSATKRHWKAERFRIIDPPSVRKCRRLSTHKVRCKSSVNLQDSYGCGYGTALVSVRATSFGVLTNVARDIFHGFYDPTTTKYDRVSCLQFGV